MQISFDCTGNDVISYLCYDDFYIEIDVIFSNIHILLIILN